MIYQKKEEIDKFKENLETRRWFVLATFVLLSFSNATG